MGMSAVLIFIIGPYIALAAVARSCEDAFEQRFR